MLGKIGVDNTYSIGVTQAVMDTYHPAAISDPAPIAGETRFGAEQDFYTDAGGMKYGPFRGVLRPPVPGGHSGGHHAEVHRHQVGQLRCHGGIRH